MSATVLLSATIARDTPPTADLGQSNEVSAWLSRMILHFIVLLSLLLDAIIVFLCIVHIDSRHGAVPLMEVVVDLVFRCDQRGMQQSVPPILN